jgi:hypothetical protein
MGLCYRDRIAVPAGNEMENDHHICFWIFHTTMRYDRVLLQNRRSRKVGISSDNCRLNNIYSYRVYKTTQPYFQAQWILGYSLFGGELHHY